MLREVFGPFDRTFMLSRLFLAWGSFTAAGWLVRGILANFQKVREQLVEIQARDLLLRDSEEQLRILIETSSAAILTLDKNGVVIQANEAAGRLLGAEKEALLGQSIEQYLPALGHVPSDQSATIFRTTMECDARRRNGRRCLSKARARRWGQAAEREVRRRWPGEAEKERAAPQLGAVLGNEIAPGAIGPDPDPVEGVAAELKHVPVVRAGDDPEQLDLLGRRHALEVRRAVRLRREYTPVPAGRGGRLGEHGRGLYRGTGGSRLGAPSRFCAR